jgi:Fic family protein
MAKYLNPKIISRLEEKEALLNKNRPLPKPALLKLREQMIVEGTYNSNAIEGNTLTLKETRLVLEQGITIAGKSMREHFEAINHRDAILFLEKIAKKRRVEEKDILTFHGLILQNIEKEFAGCYRRGQVRILGSDVLPPNYLKVPRLMDDLIIWINENPEKLHPVELAAMAQYKLVAIHPFYDGNGRTARLLMNLLLMQKTYPFVVVPVNDRKRYYNALAKADDGDHAPFVNLMAQFAERSLDLYLAAIGRVDHLVPLSRLAAKTVYSADYLSLLARRGELDATKRGKVWFSTLEAVRKYKEKRQRKR